MRIENEMASDAELVESAIQGEPVSFRLLFDRYYEMIHAFAFKICQSNTEAEDLAQETFIRAARNMSSYRGEASFKNWLYRIAHNAFIDAHRKKVRKRRLEDDLATHLITQSQTRPADYSEVHLTLKQLSPDLREVVALVYFEEMNHREAANILGCAESTVSWRLFRAKDVLKKLLKSPIA